MQYYYITYHAIERLEARFPTLFNKHKELTTWNRESGTQCLKPLFDKWIKNTEENKSYINNSVYMLNLNEKYGYDTEYKFLEKEEDNIVFLFIKKRTSKNFKLVTIMPTDYVPTVKNKKYNNMIKKEEKHNKFIMDWYDKYEKSPLLKSENNSKTIVSQITDLYRKNKTELINKFNPQIDIRKVIIDMTEYTFFVSKGGVEIKSQKELTQKEKILSMQKEYENEFNIHLTPELRKELLILVYDERTEREKLSKNYSIHKVTHNGHAYHFFLHKLSNGEPKIILQQAPQTIDISIAPKLKC